MTKIVPIYKLKNSLILFIIFLFFTACNGKFPGADARKNPSDPKKRVQKNLAEGRGITFNDVFGNEGGGKFDFASSNPLWRASLDTINFMPLLSANYSGGIIITDWYNEGNEESSVKIMVRFLSNEIRADGLKITVYNKNCKPSEDCSLSTDDEISNELKLAILKKAALYKNKKLEKEAEELEERGVFNNKELN